MAIGLARLGRLAALVGRVGCDDFGSSIVRDLRAERVIVDHLRVSENAPTGLVIKSQRRAGRWQVEYRRRNSAGSSLDETDLKSVDIANCDALHLTGITPALSDSARRATMAAVELANQYGRLVSFDVNLRTSLWPDQDRAREMLTWFVSRAGSVQASKDEAEFLTNEADPAKATVRLAEMCQADAIVRCGSEGALAVIDGRLLRVAPHPVVEIDPVGAGDAFTAAYLDGRLSGHAPEDCLSRAAVAGALVAASPGDWQGLPTDSDLTAERCRTQDVRR